jgi:SnoaL-like polyketide cyclase
VAVIEDKAVSKKTAVDIVNHFWREVWQARNPEAIDNLVAEDFVITSGGVDIHSRSEFKKWVTAFLSKISDFEFHIVETFQNETGDRVASRWRVTGKNNGILGTSACQSPIDMSGTAIWHVRDDGLLQHNWVERNSHEVFRKILGE